MCSITQKWQLLECKQYSIYIELLQHKQFIEACVLWCSSFYCVGYASMLQSEKYSVCRRRSALFVGCFDLVTFLHWSCIMQWEYEESRAPTCWMKVSKREALSSTWCIEEADSIKCHYCSPWMHNAWGYNYLLIWGCTAHMPFFHVSSLLGQIADLLFCGTQSWWDLKFRFYVKIDVYYMHFSICLMSVNFNIPLPIQAATSK